MRPIPFIAACLTAITTLMAGPAAADKIDLNNQYKLSGPYPHKNLTVFLIHGKADHQPQKIIPLAEALDRNLVTIDETGDVNRLTATNHSATEYVFIQSGDIVKGGRQDRTLSQDVLLSPSTKRTPIDAFCVEQGRWRPRGKENVTKFSTANKKLSSRKLKLAAKQAGSQGEVWRAVAEEQDKLTRNLGKSVRKEASDTSYQLSLEDEDVTRKSREFQKSLLPILDKKQDAIGLAFAINGCFNSADIYGNPALFRKLWPALIETAAIEAVSSHEKRAPQAQAKPDEVKRDILDALHCSKKKARSTKTTMRTAGETRNNYAFETKDTKNRTVHINIIRK